MMCTLTPPAFFPHSLPSAPSCSPRSLPRVCCLSNSFLPPLLALFAGWCELGLGSPVYRGVLRVADGMGSRREQRAGHLISNIKSRLELRLIPWECTLHRVWQLCSLQYYFTSYLLSGISVLYVHHFLYFRNKFAVSSSYVSHLTLALFSNFKIPSLSVTF